MPREKEFLGAHSDSAFFVNFEEHSKRDERLPKGSFRLDQIILSHGGHIEAHSALGIGTRLVVSLPRLGVKELPDPST